MRAKGFKKCPVCASKTRLGSIEVSPRRMALLVHQRVRVAEEAEARPTAGDVIDHLATEGNRPGLRTRVENSKPWPEASAEAKPPAVVVIAPHRPKEEDRHVRQQSVPGPGRKKTSHWHYKAGRRYEWFRGS